MGQGYSLNTLPPGPSTIEASELSDLIFEKPLGAARLLRSIRARHNNGVVVAKVCQKNSPAESFKRYARALKEERRALRDIPNVLPYQRIRETPTLGVLVRQFIHSSLYDRVSIRPFLEPIEKKWIAFQLLCAVRDCHSRGVFHGDIKSENVLVTSWEWVYLTDFASTYKPVYLPEDNPHEFGIYFDTSARRTCYLAPERFYAPGQKPAEPHAVQWNMDIFSVGCVIAELFTETPTFTLSQLFKYRKGEYDPTVALLSKVGDEHIRSLITSMLRLDPEERWHVQDYLDEQKGKAFPLYFYQHLHTLMQEVTDPSSGRKVEVSSSTNNGLSDDRIDRVYNDFEMLCVSLGYEPIDHKHSRSALSSVNELFPLNIDLPNSCHTASDASTKQADNGTFILLNVITSSLRSAARASSKVRACELLLAFAERVPDEAKLDRVLPYIMPLLQDESSDMVLIAGLRTMTQVLALVNVTSVVNSFLFTQYVFPRLQAFVNSPGFKKNSIVRATYATCLASLAQTASRFLDVMQALQLHSPLSASEKALNNDGGEQALHHDTYDATRSEVLDQLEAQTKVFLTDDDVSVRRAFLSSVSTLCVFLGEARAKDVILSHLNTYLNDTDWELKCAFFRVIVSVSVYIGSASLEEFILPLMIQALSDPQEFVVEQVLRSLSSIAEMGLLQRSRMWELIEIVGRFELHPNMWIREAAAHFVAAVATFLSLADIRILVVPLIRPYLKVPISSLSPAELLDALKKPLPRSVLDLALQWGVTADGSLFWKQARESRQLSDRMSSHIHVQSSILDHRSQSLSKTPKTDEDEQWLGRLRNAGMRAEDEAKLLAFREHIWRTGQRKKKGEETVTQIPYDQATSLTKLEVPLQTIIFDGDIDAYTEHMKELNIALQEATRDSIGNETTGADDDTTKAETPRKNNLSKTSALTVPELHRQTSGSGPSLSSSPGSSTGISGREGDPRRSLVGRLITGNDPRNKSLAEVATDDATATGRLHTPKSTSIPRSRRGSNGTSLNENIGNPSSKTDRRTAHNYAGNDPTVLKLLDTVYVDSFPLNAAEFGPLIQPLKPGTIHSPTANPLSSLWRPQGQLIGILGEHSARVNRIAVSPDHGFVATASDDGTVKIWDAARFERNVTHRARATYSFGPDIRVTFVCFIDSTHTFVATGSNGNVRIVKVEALEHNNGTNYRIGNTVRDWQIPRGNSQDSEYAVWCEQFRGDPASILLLATNLGRILAIDLRDMSIVYELHTPAQHGPVTCFCLGRRHDWLLVGTSLGVLDLWDLRFRLRLRSWTFPQGTAITRLQLHPSKKSARRHRVCVTGGTGPGEISVWDIEKLICHEIYRIPSLKEGNERVNAQDYELKNLDDDKTDLLLQRIAADSTLSNGSAVQDHGFTATSSLFGLCQAPEDSENQHSFVITGGPDGKVRFWDCDFIESCKTLSGLEADEKAPRYTLGSLGLDTKVVSEVSAVDDPSGKGVVESNQVGGARRNITRSESAAAGKTPRYEAIRQSASTLLTGHLDTITDVALLERPFGIVLSADRSGQIFAYQ